MLFPIRLQILLSALISLNSSTSHTHVTLVQGLRLLASSAFDKPPTPPTWLRDEVWTQLHSTQGWSNLDFLYKYIERAWMEKELLKRDPERIFLGVMTQQPIDRLMWTIVETFRDRFVSQSRTAAEWESFVRNDLQLNQSMTDIFSTYKKNDSDSDSGRLIENVFEFEHIHLSSLSLDLADRTPDESALGFLYTSSGSRAAGGGTKIGNLPSNIKQILVQGLTRTGVETDKSVDSLFRDLDTVLTSFSTMSRERFPRFLTLMSMKKPSSSSEIQASEVSYLARPYGFPSSYDHNLDGRSPAWNHSSETTYVERLKILQGVDSENRTPPLNLEEYENKQLRILNRDIAVGNVQMHTVGISQKEKFIEESNGVNKAEFDSIFDLYEHIKNVKGKLFRLLGRKQHCKSMYIQYRSDSSTDIYTTGILSFEEDVRTSKAPKLTLYHTFGTESGNKFGVSEIPSAVVSGFRGFRQVPVDEMLGLLESEVRAILVGNVV